MAKAAKNMDFNILDRWSGEVKFTAKIEADETTPMGVKLGLAVMAALANRADLTGAKLAGANLDRVNLAGANLAGANLAGANLDRVNLAGANLAGANLARANLTGAKLAGANLDRVNLAGANLAGANLDRANLDRVNLAGANLAGAKLSEEALRPFKADMWLTLTEARDPDEIRFLIAALKAGAVDGSTYGDGKSCACLVGTMGRFKRESGADRDHNAGRPAECWFTMIRPGDAPDKETGGGFAARKALGWALAWCEAVGVDPEFPATVEVPDLGPVAARKIWGGA